MYLGKFECGREERRGEERMKERLPVSNTK